MNAIKDDNLIIKYVSYVETTGTSLSPVNVTEMRRNIEIKIRNLIIDSKIIALLLLLRSLLISLSRIVLVHN